MEVGINNKLILCNLLRLLITFSFGILKVLEIKGMSLVLVS
jgi:hypothetical protein